MRLKRIDKKVIVGAGAIMLAAFLWSLDGVLIRPKFYTVPAALLVFLEHLLGFIVLSPFIIISWRKIRALDRQDWFAILWVSLLGGLIGTIMITQAFFAAFAGTVTLATVILLQKLQPIFALLMARLVLREKLNKQFYLWAGVAIFAAYWLAFGSIDLSGINIFNNAAFFALLAAFAFGSSTVFGKRIVNHLDFKATTALRFGLTSILAFVLVMIYGNIGEVWTISQTQWNFLLIIVFSSGAGAIFIYYFGLRRVPASTATIYELFWPFSAVILDYFINGNFLSTIQIIAGAILLFSIFKVIKWSQVKTIKFDAKVVKGLRRGTKMGLPTINLNKTNLDIPYGIYLVEADINGRKHLGVLHFGMKETFNEGASLELIIKEHIPGLERQSIKVTIKKYLRPIKKFKNIEELKAQIEKDIEVLN